MDERSFEGILRRMTTTHTRRQLLGRAAGGLGAFVLPTAAVRGATAQETPTPCPPGAAPEPPYGPTRIRKSIYSLALDGPELTAYRTGVTEMQNRSLANANDPTGWIFQANMHGEPNLNPAPAGSPAPWNWCQHSSSFFLSWHRMYIYWFERIVRKASGYSEFALPYWDYSDTDTAHQVLPEAFRAPAGGGTNVLFVAERRPSANAGSPPASPSIFSHSNAFALTNFSGPPASFGGSQDGAPIQFGDSAGQLERGPHNVVHTWVGGPGLMSNPLTAARDPIFWLHHANIDRLWNRWLDEGEGRENPSEAYWRDTTFCFSDEDGKMVTMTGKDILDTVTQLGYRYDDDRVPSASPTPTPAGGASSATPEPSVEATVVASSAAAPIELGAEAVQVSVPLSGSAADAIEGTPVPGAPERRIGLNLEGVRSADDFGAIYEIYLNAPPNQTPDFRSEFWVGDLSLFLPPSQVGHAHTSTTISYDITDNIRAQQATGTWLGNVDLSFVPIEIAEPAAGDATPAAAAAAAPGPFIVIDRITLTIV
jgi:tyrosinase